MPVDADRVREIVDGLKREARADVALRARIARNPVKVLAERGLNLEDQIHAHEMSDCPLFSITGLVRE
jgi:hypothetical protein